MFGIGKSRSGSKKKKSWLRKIVRAIFVLCVITASLALAGRYWLIPTILETQIKGFLAPYWEGDIHIEDIDMSLDGPIVFKRLSARGPDGREWVRVQSVKLQMDNWPSLSPVLRRIEINNPAVIAFVDKGVMHLPLKWPESDKDAKTSHPKTQPATMAASGSDKKGFFDVQKISLQDISVTVVESNSPAHCELTWKPALPQIELVTLRGMASAEGDIDIYLGEKKHVDAQFQARLDLLNVTVTDLRKFLGLPEREEKLAPLVLNRIQVHEISFRNGVLTIPDYYVESCDGKIWGRARALIKPGRPFQYEVDDLRAVKINLRKFYDAYDPTRHVEFGTAGLFVDIDGKGLHTKGMVVEGILLMDNSDLDQTVVVGGLLEDLHVNAKDIKEGSDLQVMFEIRENVATFARARLGNNILAIDMIPYGTVNLETGMMDFVVVSAFLKDLRKIPILGIVGGLGQGMSRLRIHGYWYQPRHEIVHKEPIVDLAKSTENFFKDTLSTGGHILDMFANIVPPKPKPQPAK